MVHLQLICGVNTLLFELTEIMRQKDDKAFAEILNRLHIGIHTKKDLDIIETSRVT